MSHQFDLCFSTKSRTSLPIDTSNKLAYKQFRQDNPHILGSFIPAGTPFIVSESGSDSVKLLRESRPDIACALDGVNSWSQSTKRNITNLVDSFGSIQAQAIAELYEKELQPYLRQIDEIMGYKVDSFTATGAAATSLNAKEVRLSRFGGAILKYQKSLMDIRTAAKNKAPKKELIKLGNLAKNAHIELNEKFTKELKAVSSRLKSGARGNVWNNPQRGINQAISSRNSASIQITSLSGVRNLRALEVGSSVLGNGLIVLDAVVRTDKVYTEYQSGGNWGKTAAVQAAGFGAGTAAGLAVGAETIALGTGIAIAMGPVGWVILIGVGLGTGYAASKFADNAAQRVANKAYDLSDSWSW